MQADQTVISLRPGGRNRGGSRVHLGPRFDTSSDLPLLRPHGSSSSSSKVTSISDDILKIKQEVESELFGEDANRTRADSNVQSQIRYSEPDSRDWRTKSAQLSAPIEDRSWDALRDRQQETNQYNWQELSSQFARTQISPSRGGGPAPALIKAELPWSARRGSLSDKDRVLKTVKGILNKLTPEKFDLLKGQLIDSGITSADILKGVISLIFDKAVLEPTFCPMYANCVLISMKSCLHFLQMNLVAKR